MFYVKKGNWYIDQYTWAEYGLFYEEENAPFLVVQSEEIADFIVQKLNEEYEANGWKGDIDRFFG